MALVSFTKESAFASYLSIHICFEEGICTSWDLAYKELGPAILTQPIASQFPQKICVASYLKSKCGD
jgi:hypothetical protein